MPQTTAIDGTGPVLVRVVSDGTAGMRLQALALAESLQRARPDWKCDEFTITPHPLTRAMPRLAAWLPSMPLYGSTPPGRGTGRGNWQGNWQGNRRAGRRAGGRSGGGIAVTAAACRALSRHHDHLRAPDGWVRAGDAPAGPRRRQADADRPASGPAPAACHVRRAGGAAP